MQNAQIDYDAWLPVASGYGFSSIQGFNVRKTHYCPSVRGAFFIAWIPAFFFLPVKAMNQCRPIVDTPGYCYLSSGTCPGFCPQCCRVRTRSSHCRLVSCCWRSLSWWWNQWRRQKDSCRQTRTDARPRISGPNRREQVVTGVLENRCVVGPACHRVITLIMSS